MRAAIYARFSTDKQSAASVDDQQRLCEQRASREGWTVVARHADPGMSGSLPIASRPGAARVIADALAGRIDVLLIEGLDRLSRDQVESEQTIRRLEHRGVRIVGVSDGYDSTAAGRKLTRGVKSLMNELFLDDLRQKTHRGLAGKVERGHHAGGKSYGYSTVADGTGRRLVIDPAQAEWVVWIYQRYVDGWSPQKIAHELNARGVPAPRSGTWAVSAIYGNVAKGLGVLNNPLYAGRVVWNRGQWVKDPDSGRRRRIERPREEWLEQDRPDLRIVPQPLWDAVQARMGLLKPGGRRGGQAPGRTLFGGLLRCGHCGGAVVAVDATYYGCAAAKDRGPSVCRGVRVRRVRADARLVAVVRDQLAAPGAIAEFELAARDAERQASAGQRAEQARRERRLAEIDAELRRIVDAIAATGILPALADRLRLLEAEKRALQQPVETGGPVISATAAVAAYRRLLADLQTALTRDRDRARTLLRQVFGEIVLEADDEGAVAAISAATPLAGVSGSDVQMDGVAGARSLIRL